LNTPTDHLPPMSGIFSNLTFNTAIELITSNRLIAVIRRASWSIGRVVLIEAGVALPIGFNRIGDNENNQVREEDELAGDWQVEVLSGA